MTPTLAPLVRRTLFVPLLTLVTACGGSSPEPVIQAVEITPTDATIAAGQSFGLRAEVFGEHLDDTSIRWSIRGGDADDSITNDGLFTAGIGADEAREVTVVATSNAHRGVSDEAVLTIEPVPPDVFLVLVTPMAATVGPERQFTFSATVAGTRVPDESVVWTISDDSYGDVITDDGVFTSGPAVLEQRTIEVVATSVADSEMTGRATVTVEPIAVHAVNVTSDTDTVAPGGTATLTAVVEGRYVTDHDVTWSLEDTTAGDAIDADGVFTAGPATAGDRTVTVIATSDLDPSVQGAVTLTVEGATVDAVTLSPDTANVAPGGTLAMTATVEGEHLADTSVTWSLEGAGEGDAIDAAGVFTAGPAGTEARSVTVVATSNADPDVRATATLTIEPEAVTSVTVTPGTATASTGESLTFTADVQGEHLTDESVTWSLLGAGPGDAIDADGVFTAGHATTAARTVTVVATSNADGSVVGEATVTVNPLATVDDDTIYVDLGTPGDPTVGEPGSQANPFADIAAGLAAVPEGGTVMVAAGTYVLGSTLSGFTDGVTLRGAGVEQVVVDASGLGAYGLHVAADDVTLAGFTVEGPQSEAAGNYGLKVQPGVTGLTVEDVTVQHSHRSQIDLNGVSDVVLRRVTVIGGTEGGVGVALTGATNVVFESVSSSGNPWGGVGIYSGPALEDGAPPRVTSEVFLDSSNTIEDGIYIDDEYADGDQLDYAARELAIEGLAYQITNDTYRSRAADQLFFVRDVSEVEAFLTHVVADETYVPDTLVRTVTLDDDGFLQPGADLLVLEGMDVQLAVDAAAQGATVTLGAGTFDGGIVVDEAIALEGAGMEETTVLGGGSGVGVLFLGDDAEIEGASVRDLAVTGFHAGLKLEGDVRDFTVERVNASANGNSGLLLAFQAARVTGLTLIDSHFDDNGSFGLDFELGSEAPAADAWLSGLTVRSSTFDDNDKKGVYVESLSDALFEDVQVVASGVGDVPWNAGIDVNLKYGDYSGLTFRRVTVRGSGAAGTATDPQFPVAVTLKARDDGAYASDPATLDDVVIESCDFRGLENGLRLGEPGKTNAGPTNVVLRDTNLVGLGQELGGGYALLNVTSASVIASEGNTFNGVSGAAAASEVFDQADEPSVGPVVLE